MASVTKHVVNYSQNKTKVRAGVRCFSLVRRNYSENTFVFYESKNGNYVSLNA